jgi:PAS domain S-box-containing protein
MSRAMPPPPGPSTRHSEPPAAEPRGSDAHIRELAEHLDVVFWLSSADRRRALYVSPSVERVFGRSPESVYRDPRVLADAIHPEDRAALAASAASEPAAFEAEYRIVRPDGAVRWIHGRSFPVRDASGEPVRIAGICQDVTARKRLELELRGRNAVFEQLAADAPLERVLATVVAISEEIHPGILGSVLLVDRDHDHLRHGAAPSLPDFYVRAIDGIAIGPGVGSCGSAAHSGELVIVEDVRTHPFWSDFRELAERAGLRACWSQPIVSSGGEVLGTFAMYYREPRAPSAGERAHIEAVARLAALAIERRRAVEALRESQRNLAEAQRIAHVGSWEWNIVRDEVRWSDELYRIAGLRREEFDATYEAFLERVHPDDRKRVRESVRATIERGEPYRIHCRLVLPSGALRFLESSAELARDAQGRPLRLVGTARDVTEQIRADEERRRLEAQMRHAQQLESLGLLAGGIAHDFNNLLSVILGNSELALDELERGSPLEDKLRRVREAAHYAAELVDQILTYSGRPSIRLEPVALSRLVEQTRALLAASLAGRCALRIELAADLPSIEGDPTQIRRVLLNLVTNACEALPEGRGHVTLRTGLVRADAALLARAIGAAGAPPGEYVWLEVEDDGPGMDADTRARVFDPFFTTKVSGRGLGLAAVLGIVRAHRGVVLLESEPGAGTRLRVLFPRAPALEARAPSEAPSSEATPASECVLAVDDEQWVLDVAREFLERAGYRVISACGGREALARLREHVDEIDAVVLDVAMPDVDGAAAFEEVRRMRPDLPIVLVSGYNQEIAGRRIATAKAAGFVRKPYEPEELLRQLRRALGSRPS